jgi:DNA-directed RNA polymerase specialized sigma subunit
MEEIGDMLGLGRSRVHQEEKAAWAVMRKWADDGL